MPACAIGWRSTFLRNVSPFDKTNSWVGYGMSHLDLLGHPAVYARLRDWLA